MQGTAVVWAAQASLEDVGAKLGMCRWSWEIPVMSLTHAGHQQGQSVPSPLRVLGLGQQGLICLSVAPWYSQNGVAQPIRAQPCAGSLEFAGLGSASSKALC